MYCFIISFLMGNEYVYGVGILSFLSKRHKAFDVFKKQLLWWKNCVLDTETLKQLKFCFVLTPIGNSRYLYTGHVLFIVEYNGPCTQYVWYPCLFIQWLELNMFAKLLQV